MRHSRACIAAAAAVVAVCALAVPAAFAGTARAADTPSIFARGADHAVFVQTDNLAGNQIVAYSRAADGTLTAAGTVATGGLGGALAGSAVDHLASQGSLTYDQRHALLYAVNAGSNTVSVFSVRGDRLSLIQVLGSGGTFPVSVTVHGDVVYVLNAENGGNVQGFFVLLDRLIPLPGSNRALGLNPAATPQFTNTPGQVAFTPDGSELIVTTKANGSAVDVFGVGPFGLLSAGPVVNPEPGAVPFAISFDRAGHLVIAEAGTNALATFRINPDRTITQLAAGPTGQAATCWVAPVDGLFYASNAGSGSVTGFRSGGGGQLALLGNTTTDPGTVDASASSDGRFLYVQTGAAGIVDEFHINGDGSLTGIGSVTVPGAVGGEGITAF
jgi:Lactonase, 7-bladed beta-propeller